MRELSGAAVASRKKKVPIPWAEREAVLNDTLSLPQRKQGGCAFCESAESGKETGVISCSLLAAWGCSQHLGYSP